VSVSFATQPLLKADATGFWQTLILSCSTLPHVAKPIGWSTTSIQLEKDAALIYLKTFFKQVPKVVYSTFDSATSYYLTKRMPTYRGFLPNITTSYQNTDISKWTTGICKSACKRTLVICAHFIDETLSETWLPILGWPGRVAQTQPTLYVDASGGTSHPLWWQINPSRNELNENNMYQV